MALSKGSLMATQVIGSKFKDFVYRYSDKDVILYSLGIGSTLANPTCDPLRFLYEGHSRFSVHPTFATVPAMGVMIDAIRSGDFNGFRVDPKWIVLGEQYVEVFRPLPPFGVMTSRGTVADIVDKGKSGVVVAVNIETFDLKTMEKYAFIQTLFFVRGHRELRGQGQGQDRLPRSSERIVELAEVPDRAPDAEVEETIGSDQAATFRLSSSYDGNPLHIDDAYAREAGYPAGHNIHGVCLLGIVARQAVAGFFGNEVDRFKGVKVRVTAPVFPSDVTRTEMWREETKTGSTRIHVRVRNLNRGTVCVDRSYVDFV